MQKQQIWLRNVCKLEVKFFSTRNKAPEQIMAIQTDPLTADGKTHKLISTLFVGELGQRPRDGCSP